MMPVERLPEASWYSALTLGFVSAVFDNIPLTALAIEQGGFDWGMLAYAVGFGGSMIWFGSSAGVALSNMYPQAKSVGAWLRHGWYVPVAYVIGFAALLLILGWQPHRGLSGGCACHRGAPPRNQRCTAITQVIRRNPPQTHREAFQMIKFLVPVDGSESAQHAVRHLIQLAHCREPAEIHLLNVRKPIEAWEVRRFLTTEEITQTQQDEGETDCGPRAPCSMRRVFPTPPMC